MSLRGTRGGAKEAGPAEGGANEGNQSRIGDGREGARAVEGGPTETEEDAALQKRPISGREMWEGVAREATLQLADGGGVSGSGRAQGKGQ